MPSLASRRLSLYAGALSLLCVATHSFAAGTTTIKLQTSPGNYCVATTGDSNGIHLDPQGSAAMLVDGVTLAEAPGNAANSHACQVTGGSGGSADFQLSNLVISQDANGSVTNFTPALNSPFYVNWSVSAEATTCVRTGSANITAASVNGWTLGSVVSSPAGAHHDSVTPLQSGSYSFGVICSNATGYKTATAPTVPGAPQTTAALTLSTTTATTGSPPSPAAVTVTANNSGLAGATCTGTLANGSTTITSGWTGWTSSFTVPATGALSQSVTLPNAVAPGSYTFKMACTNGMTEDSTHPATLTVSDAVVTSCSATIPANDPRLAGVTDKAARVRMNTADVQYNAVPQGARTGVSFAEFANLWGFADATTAPPAVAWPGIGGASPGFMMARNGYFGAHFKTPPAASPPSQTSSYFTYTTYGSTDPISVSITTSCGDFSGDPGVNACYANDVASNDGKSMNWIYDSTGSQGVSKYFCYLKPNTDYYLNVMFTATTPPSTPKCSAAATTGQCRIRYTRR